MSDAIDLTGEPLIPAMTAFLTKFSTPAIDENHVILGQYSSSALPTDGNDFCVFTPVNQQRSGTTVQEWHPETQTTILCEYVTVTVQVDCYSSDPIYARERAQTYELVARSPMGVKHFKRYGMDCQYAEGVRNLTGLLDDSRYVSRWMFEIRLGYTKRVSVPQRYFDAVRIDVHNADVSFYPRGK